ncbi:MAG TPA: STAS domain-containing protein [Polyangiaceae bacterium]|nr:STAS domain-containing protein [Polyangiaceae bacterium]
MSEDIEVLKDQLRRAEELVDLLLTHNPDGIVIVDSMGKVTVNPAASAIADPGGAVPTSMDEIQTGALGIFYADGKTRVPDEEQPNLRALRGETVRDEVYCIRSPNRPHDVYVQANAVALEGRRSLMVFRDITERKRLEESLEQRSRDLAQKAGENEELVNRLRIALEDSSTPVLELWDDVLALPVVGIVDTQRSVQMSERLLKEVMDRRARYVIIDLTGVDVVDTSTADRLFKLSRAVSLLGAECVLTGIQPNVAQTLVELGVEFGTLKTQRNLKRALDVYLGRSTVRA